MADWRDVMAARSHADAARCLLDDFIPAIDRRDRDGAALAFTLAGLAITAELRALGTTLDYAMTNHTAATGRL